MAFRLRAVYFTLYGTRESDVVIGDCKSNNEIATQLKWTKATVGKWRQPLVEQRLSGL